MWVASFDFPDVETDYLFVALRRPDIYPIESGKVASSDGLDVDAAGFASVAVEEQAARSTALHCRLWGTRTYLTGPLARYALNSAVLSEVAQQAAAAGGLGPVCRNPFRSIVVRSVELVLACDEALRLVESYEPPDPAAFEVPPSAGVRTGATEAPRGLLLQRYELDSEGIIRSARIMPPTSQNQLAIEEDLRAVVQSSLDLSDDELTASL